MQKQSYFRHTEVLQGICFYGAVYHVQHHLDKQNIWIKRSLGTSLALETLDFLKQFGNNSWSIDWELPCGHYWASSFAYATK